MRNLPSRSKPSIWCPPICENNTLSGKQAVNRSSGCSCNHNPFSDGGSSYDWYDLFDQPLTIQKTTAVYQLPDFNSGIVRYLAPGDQISIYSFVNYQGKTWLQFYTPPLQYPDWIPLDGTPGGVNTIPASTINTLFDPEADIPTLLTTEEKEELNNSIFEDTSKLLKTVLLGIAGIVILNKL